MFGAVVTILTMYGYAQAESTHAITSDPQTNPQPSSSYPFFDQLQTPLALKQRATGWP